MSEIVFPNEALAEVDLTHPLNTNILTLQLDNGTTVTNAITNATGESFDVANQYGEISADGVRMSATWSYPLTAAELNDVNENPYQLFRLINNTPSNTTPIEFDVGAGRDYSTFSDFCAAQINTNSITGAHYKAYIYGAMTDTGTLSMRNNNNVRYTCDVIAGDNYFDNIDTGFYHFINASFSQYRYTTHNFKGLRLKGSNTFRGYGEISSFKNVESCLIKDVGYLFNNHTTSTAISIKDSVIDNLARILSGNFKSLFFMNNIVMNTSAYNSKLLNSAKITAYNNLCSDESNGTTNGIFGANTLGSHNTTEDSTASDYGLGTQDANVLTYFTDAQNGDYRINEAGKIALTGRGWNGSDIVGWAYAVINEVNATQVALSIAKSIQPITAQLLSSSYILQTSLLASQQSVLSSLPNVTLNTFSNIISAQQPQTGNTTSTANNDSFELQKSIQPCYAGLLSVLTHKLFTVAQAQQPSQGKLIELHVGDQATLLNAEQLQHAFTTSISEIQQATLNNVSQPQNAALATIKQAFDAILVNAEQQQYSESITIIDMVKYSSLTAYQEQKTKTTTMFSAVMPDLDYDSVIVVSMSEQFTSQSQSEQFNVH